MEAGPENCGLICGMPTCSCASVLEWLPLWGIPNRSNSLILCCVVSAWQCMQHGVSVPGKRL